MKRIELKKVSIVFLTMLLFLSIQIPAFATDTDTTVKIPVEQVFDSKNTDASDEFMYALLTDQSDAPMPDGSSNHRYVWNMKGNIASDGTEYLNEDHSKDALDFTFTEKNLDADGAITIPEIHTKRGYRLINMAINGTTLAETTGNNREIPTEEGTGHGITMDANCGDTSYLVTVVMNDSFTTHLGNEKDCSYAYSIKIKPRRGNWQDIN